MGSGGEYRCINCGYVINGIMFGGGFLSCPNHPSVREEILRGEYGKRAKEILESDPDARFFAHSRVYCCNCGNMFSKGVVTMCTDRKRNYPLSVKCDRCGKRMHGFDSPPEMVPCPRCQSPMGFSETLLWD